MEGVYGWIAVNYILGRFSHSFDADTSHRPPTVGALDMGGASMQITYEVPRSEEVPSDLALDIDLGCQDHSGQKSHSYHLYSSTFLGFGTNEARKSYVQLLLEQNEDKVLITDPCLLKGMQESQKNANNKQVILTGGGDFTLCRQNLYPLLKIPTTCARSPCSMNGVFQPPINFYKDEMYGFSEYWYTMNDLLRLGGHYREDKFIAAASEYCATEWSVLNERYKSGLFPGADQDRFQYQCFKSAWVLAALHDGHRFPSNYKHFNSVNTIKGEIIQWTYGAMIYRTRFLPLRDRGVDKVLSARPVSKLDVMYWYTAIFCFAIVLFAILFWAYKIRKMRSSSFLPSTLQDLSEQFTPISLKPDQNPLLNSFKYSSSGDSMINFNDVCAPPQNSCRFIDPPAATGVIPDRSIRGLLPRSYSESLLNRDIG